MPMTNFPSFRQSVSVLVYESQELVEPPFAAVIGKNHLCTTLSISYIMVGFWTFFITLLHLIEFCRYSFMQISLSVLPQHLNHAEAWSLTKNVKESSNLLIFFPSHSVVDLVGSLSYGMTMAITLKKFKVSWFMWADFNLLLVCRCYPRSMVLL